MPSSLRTVVGWINNINNRENQRVVSQFIDFMTGTDASDKYQRGNLIVVWCPSCMRYIRSNAYF
jgi:hypothetical protein